MDADAPRRAKKRTPAPYRDLSRCLRDVGGSHGGAAAAQEMHERVARALASFQTIEASRVQAERIERQREIIARCELEGQLHKVVAADLHISMRTFYRERLEAFARLRRALSADSLVSPVRPAGDGIALRIERAWEQACCGRIREAIVRLEEITSSAPPALLAIAYARLSAARFLVGDDPRSGEALTRAKRSFAILGPGAASAAAEAEIWIVEALRLQARGSFEDALRLHERIAACLSSAPNGLASARLALLGRIDAHLARGSAAAAFELTELEQDTDPVIGAARAECSLVLGGDDAQVERDALDAYEAARDKGYVLTSARALCTAAHASAGLADRTNGFAHVRTARGIARELPPGRLFVGMMLDLASAFSELGDGDAALALLDECAVGDVRSDFVAGIARAREAEAFVALGQHGEAARRAAEAVRILSGFDSTRFLGEALLASACAAFGCGNPRGARTLAVRAERLLRGASWPSRVARAARLGVRRSARRARMVSAAPSCGIRAS